jgi:NAD(P)-dependent dehydrogenase (short-subunit alcohol dehydrogenase family)
VTARRRTRPKTQTERAGSARLVGDRRAGERRLRDAAVAGPLAGRVAFVTGAGRGIGRAVATTLAEAGASVVLAARTRSEVTAAARDLSAGGAPALALPCDVRDARSVRAAVGTAVRRFGRLDILVNNAGTFQIATLADTDEELWDSILDTNLKGAYLVTRAALPHLVQARGHIIDMVSLAARVVFPGNAAYAAAKWGLLGFTNVLREELRPHGVRVTALLPAAVDTSIWDSVPGRWNRSRMLRPEAVAQAVLEVLALPDRTSVDEIVLTRG